MTTEIFVYIPGNLPCSIGQLEDELDDALIGLGEVSGSGVGKGGANVDLAITDSEVKTAIERTRLVLSRLGIAETAVRFDMAKKS